jgi:NADH-quinone oxidoreductase subunit C
MATPDGSKQEELPVSTDEETFKKVGTELPKQAKPTIATTTGEVAKTEIRDQSIQKNSTSEQMEEKLRNKDSSVDETIEQEGTTDYKEKSVQTSPSSDDSATPKAPLPAVATAGKARPASGARPRPAAKIEKTDEPSPQQPLLERFADKLKETVGAEAIEEAYINRLNSHLPTLVIKKDYWSTVATLLKEEPTLSFNYVRNLSAVDYQTHIEVVYHLISLEHSHQVAVRVKTDREDAQVPSVSRIWSAADWNEREVFDLLGVHFQNHPNLKRILMPDDWVGHPLRKDYEPLDKEV